MITRIQLIEWMCRLRGCWLLLTRQIVCRNHVHRDDPLAFWATPGN